jgi:CHAT domain-containing protein/Tfp pilus assembly protein PilF
MPVISFFRMAPTTVRRGVLVATLTLALAGAWGLTVGAGPQSQAQQPQTVEALPKPSPETVALAAKIANAGTDAERTALLEANPTLVTPSLAGAVVDAGGGFESKGDLPGARGVYLFALRLAERLGDQMNVQFADLALGVLDGRQGHYEQALERFARVKAGALVSGRRPQWLSAAGNIALVHRLQGDVEVALEEQHEVLRTAEEQGRDEFAASTMNNIGTTLLRLGRYREALTYYERARSIREKQGKSAELAGVISNIGAIHEVQGDHETALSYFRMALQMRESSGQVAGITSTLNNLGRALSGLKRTAEALATFRRVLSLAETTGEQPVRAHALFNIATIHRDEGRLDEAQQALEQALVIAESTRARPEMLQTLSALAALKLGRRQFDMASTDVQRAIQLARDANARSGLAEALSVAGAIAEATNRRAEARAAFEEAVTLTEALRDDVVGGSQALARFLETRLAPYYGLTNLSFNAGTFGDALKTAERARARVLLDTLRYGRTDIRKAMTPDERERESELRRAVAAKSAQLASARAQRGAEPAKVATLSAELDAARAAQAGFDSELRAKHPELTLQRGIVPPLDLNEIGGVLPAGRGAAVEFVVTDHRTLVFVLTRRAVTAADASPAGPDVDIKAYAVPIARAELAARVATFRDAIASRDLTVQRESRALYTLLLGPAAVALGSVSELILLPDGPLWDLPFQALQPSAGVYLVEKTALSYAPSLSVLREMQRLDHRRSAPPSAAWLFAMGSSGAGAPGVSAARDASTGALTPLVEAEQQARAVANVWGRDRSTLLLGPEALKDRFKSGAPQSQLVHISAHAVLDNSSPMRSYLVLSPPAGGSAGAAPAQPEQALLDATELMDTDLKASLVVLSACETARGKLGGGEGLIGMTWAVFVAGAPSLVVSQWKVGAASTTALITEFHRQLKATVSKTGGLQKKAAALRQAALSMLKSEQYRHPFYWAGFVVMGDGS